MSPLGRSVTWVGEQKLQRRSYEAWKLGKDDLTPPGK